MPIMFLLALCEGKDANSPAGPICIRNKTGKFQNMIGLVTKAIDMGNNGHFLYRKLKVELITRVEKSFT